MASSDVLKALEPLFKKMEEERNARMAEEWRQFAAGTHWTQNLSKLKKASDFAGDDLQFDLSDE